MSRDTLRAFIDAHLNTNGLSDITGGELNQLLNSLALEALIKGEPNDIGHGLAWSADTDDFLLEVAGLEIADINLLQTTLDGKAALAGAEFTGQVDFDLSPTVPTPGPGDNSTKAASTAYVDSAVGAGFAANDALLFKGTIDASGNPNYPAADSGHTYRISVAGKIGGASGPNVEINDTIYCIVDGTAAGTHAAVGANWVIVQSNLDGAVIGPASVTNSNPVLFDGTTGKLIKETTYAAFKSSLAIAAADVAGLAAIATSGSASDLSAGTVPNARISGAYTGFSDITMSGDLSIGGGEIIATADLTIRHNTSDGADSRATVIASGGAALASRGAYIGLYGNEHGNTGILHLVPGDSGFILFEGDLTVNGALNLLNSTQISDDVSGNLLLSRAGSGAVVIPAGNLVLSAGSVTVNSGAVSVNRTAAGNCFTGTTTDATATHGPSVVLHRDSNSAAVADEIGGIFFQANEATTDTVLTYCAIRNILRAVGNGAEDGEMQFQTVMNGALGARLLMGLGLWHALATGGDKGNGSINFDAVYDDNVLLTCIPLQKRFLDNGEIDLAFWDARVPDQVEPETINPHTGEVMRGRGFRKRTHKVARIFKTLVDGGCDPRDPPTYFARMRADEALPGMPTKLEWQQAKYPLGEMQSRVWLAQEMLAITVMKMHDRMVAAGI